MLPWLNVLYKKCKNLLLFFTDAALRARGIPPFEPIDIPIGSQVYVQYPGTRVLTGILQTEANDYLAPVFVRKHNGESLTANLEDFHHNMIRTNNEYRCYVLLPDRTVLVTFLRPYNPRQDNVRSMSIFVRGPFNNLLVGLLQRGEGHRPEWLL